MSEMKVEEARLLAVFRAIKELGDPTLVGTEDVGWILSALEDAIDLDKKEAELSGAALKQLVVGFVAGVAAAQPRQVQISPEQLEQYYQHLPVEMEEEESGHFVGGPTGGVALEQGHDPNYVTQTGVRKGQNDE